MKVPLLSLAMLLLVCVGAARPDEAAKKELAKLKGVWQVVSGEEDGKPSTDYLVQHLKWEFAGNQLTFTGIKPLTDSVSKLTITIDPSTTPKCIDLKIEAGTLKGDVFEGAYEWKGAELKMCLHLGKGNRPLEFETRNGSNRVLFVLKRDKEHPR